MCIDVLNFSSDCIIYPSNTFKKVAKLQTTALGAQTAVLIFITKPFIFAIRLCF